MPVPAALTESESCLTTAFAELGLGLRCRPPLCRWIEQEAQPEASGGNRPGLLLFVQGFDSARRNFATATFWMTCPRPNAPARRGQRGQSSDPLSAKFYISAP